MKFTKLALCILLIVSLGACCINCPDAFKVDPTTIKGIIIEKADSNTKMGLIRLFPNRSSGTHTMYSVPYYYNSSLNIECGSAVEFNLSHSEEHKITVAQNLRTLSSTSERSNTIAYNSEFLMNDHTCANHQEFGAHTKWHIHGRSTRPKKVQARNGGIYYYLPLIDKTSGSNQIATKHVFMMTTDFSQILDSNYNPKIDPKTNKPYIFYLNETPHSVTIADTSGLQIPSSEDNTFILSNMINIDHDKLPH